MKFKNKYLTVFIVSIFMVQPVSAILGAKKTAKSAKPSQKQTQISSTSNAEIYIFPSDTEKQPFKPVKRVITGIFTNKQQKKAEEEEKAKASEKEKIQLKEKAPRGLNQRTIAWTTPMGLYYHDPHANCSNTTERVWAEENKELVGFEPCPDCFKKVNKIPEFIKKQSANYEIANSEKLLTNNDFINWIKERFPVKDMNFISGTKVLAYPTLDMTSKGMHQLAIEIQGAYLRQTWRVIEVQVKSNPNVVEYVSSFSPTDKLLGVVEKKDNAESKNSTDSSKKAPYKPRLFH